MNIELHIERLILDGLQVAAQDRAHLQAALETELTRLLTSDGLRPDVLSGGPLRSLSAGEIHVTSKTSAAQLGNQIAQAVHGGVGVDTERQNKRDGGFPLR